MTDMKTEYVFRFPDDYDVDAEIIEAKGWMIGHLRIADITYELCFCCPMRLQQDVASELSMQPCYTQRNLVVVAAVTQQNVTRVVDWLVNQYGLEDFVPDA